MPVTCPHCGQRHSADARFCPETGLLLAPAPPPPRYAPPSRQPLAVFVLLGFAGLVMIGIGAWAIYAEAFPAGFPRAADFTPIAALGGTPAPIVADTAAAVPVPPLAVTEPPPTPISFTEAPPTVAPTDTPPSAAQAYPATPLRGRIVFTCFDGNDDEICLMNADGSDLAQLTYNSEGDFYASLSPDGDYIVFAHQISGSNYEIFRMDTGGFGVTQLTFNGGGNFAPAYSPDGSLIAFTSTQDGDGQQIWVMEGILQHQLTTEGINEDPSWSPDGGRIAFASSRSGSVQIWVMDADGSGQRQVTDADDLGGRNSWSPDGRTLAFYAGRREDRSRNIYLISIDGNNVQQLTLDGDNLAPSFSPDGNWIAFTSYRDGDNDIYAMRPDGTNVINLTQNSGSDYQPRWGP